MSNTEHPLVAQLRDLAGPEVVVPAGKTYFEAIDEALCAAADALDTQAQRMAELTGALVHALDWLEAEGCDCGVDEPGTCALCEAKAALRPEKPEKGEGQHE